METFNYNENYIMSCDFIISKKNDNIRVDYLAINNDIYDKMHYLTTKKYINININDNEELILRKNIINYIENIAREEKISKIIIDIHNNLRNAELNNEGFIFRFCADNPFWFEAVKKINHHDKR